MSLLKMTHLSLVVFVRMWFEGLICRYIECAFPILGAEGTVIINQSFISFGSHKMMYFSQGLMLSSNICLKERCLIWTAHPKDVFCVLLFKGTLTSVVFLVLLFTLELWCVLVSREWVRGHTITFSKITGLVWGYVGLFNFLKSCTCSVNFKLCILWFAWLGWRKQCNFHNSEILVCLTNTKQTSNFIIHFMRKLAPPTWVITRNRSHLSVTINFV